MSLSDVAVSLRQRIRDAAHDRCGYCLSPQRYVMGTLEIEHLTPHARGGSDEESNLWLSCGLCNRYKGSQIMGIDSFDGATVELFNPRTQVWREHFRWSPDGTNILGVTPIGRTTVEALRLNNELAVEVRRNWVLAGIHLRNEVQASPRRKSRNNTQGRFRLVRGIRGIVEFDKPSLCLLPLSANYFANSRSSPLAACKSGVSNPSVNQS